MDFGELSGDLEYDIDVMILEAKADVIVQKNDFFVNENGIQ